MSLTPDYPNRLGNDILYRMCSDYPNHNDLNVVHSKIWLVSYAYSTHLHRKSGSNALGNVAKTLHVADIDSITSLCASIQSINLRNIHISIEVHAKICGILQSVLSVNPRSFVSKYLHFHYPNAFFMYDSKVVRNIRLQIKQHQGAPKKFDLDKTVKLNNYDKNYMWYCLRAIYYRDTVKNLPGASPREVDRYLYPY